MIVHSGAGRIPMRYLVEEARDGTSFSARRVVAEQGGTPLFVATVSFHELEPGPTYEMPASGHDPWSGRPTPGPLRVALVREPRRPRRPRFLGREVWPPAWFRAPQALPDSDALHAQALVYLTDHGATRAVRQPHADHPRVEVRMSVSLDHTVWLHEPIGVDQWLLTEFGRW